MPRARDRHADAGAVTAETVRLLVALNN